MPKLILLLLIPFLLLINNPVSASELDYETKKTQVIQQRTELQMQIAEVEQKINTLPKGDEKEKAINENIKLKMKDTKLKAYEEAYNKVLQQTEVQPQSNNPFLSPVELTPGEVIPHEYINIYKEAGAKYGVDWWVLASIHKIETGYSTSKTMLSSAGATGHMQFMPATFKAYGVDGNGNGTRSPWELEDAIFSTAHYLSASGYSKDVRTGNMEL